MELAAANRKLHVEAVKRNFEETRGGEKAEESKLECLI